VDRTCVRYCRRVSPSPLLQTIVDSAAKPIVRAATWGIVSRERTIPVHQAFEPLLPGAVVQRGSTIGCTGGAAVSLAMALAAGPSQQGAWVGVAGLADLGLRAAAEMEVALDRLVSVTEPLVPFTDQQWADVVAAMIDGFDLVVLGPSARHIRSGTARRLQSRLQSRGAVLVVVGGRSAFGSDLELAAATPAWEGLGMGHGVASARRVLVQASGRRIPRARTAEMWLPDASGRLAARLPLAVPTADPVGSPLRRTG
jgi:hypothetical protein